jgi:hypothetical protein
MFTAEESLFYGPDRGEGMETEIGAEQDEVLRGGLPLHGY